DALRERGERARLRETALADERLTGRPVRIERVGLTAGAVQGKHQLRAQSLTQRVPPDEVLDLGQQGEVMAELELRGEAPLEHREPKLLEAPDRRLRERLVG